MEKKFFGDAVKGAIVAAGYADILLNVAIRRFGIDREIVYPGTNYELPVIYSLNKKKVRTLGDLPLILGEVKALLPEEPTYENMLIAGKIALYAAEIIEALRYLEPVSGDYCGFVNDAVLREHGLMLVDDTLPGVGFLTGRTDTDEEAAAIVKMLQERGILILACNEIIGQLRRQRVKIGIEFDLFPLGEFTAAVHAVNFAVRVGLTFGNISRGSEDAMRGYLGDRLRVFVMALGEQDNVERAVIAGARYLNIPVICNHDVGRADGFYFEADHEKIVEKALEVRDIKVKIDKIDIPVTYGPAFEGERIRRPDMHCEMGGGKGAAFELCRMAALDQIKDGDVNIVGKDLEDYREGGSFACIAEVAGKKMQKDFEGVIERKFHDYLNYGEGILHIAQRDLLWIRISRDAFSKGFRLRHIGRILHAKIHADYPSIVDKVRVTIYTEDDEVARLIEEARKIYRERDERTRGMTDEAADVFYSCTLCQSFAPDHVCIVTPERTGLCGGINWLDAKAGYEITPAGANQPIEKGEGREGEYDNINRFVSQASHGKVDRFNLYSLIEWPCTSCGCFECIAAVLPECNGVMVVNREFQGDTPSGMRFSTLAGSIGGGVQTPGFLGIAKLYIVSKKFLLKEGGIKRIVWMPRELKEFLKDKLEARLKEAGMTIDMIADETNATDSAHIMEYIAKKGHPAVTMESIM
ncbi:MAG: acetyl-CoA decarbonylase/synthase complex subunit alpha/beta [archaeon]